MEQYVYRAILRLYPPEHRAVFGQEMISAFEQGAVENQRIGSFRWWRFSREIAGLVRGIVIEWLARRSDREGYLASRCLLLSDPNMPTDVAELQMRLRRALGCMEYAIAHHDFPKARIYSDEERVTREQLTKLMRNYGLEEPSAS